MAGSREEEEGDCLIAEEDGDWLVQGLMMIVNGLVHICVLNVLFNTVLWPTMTYSHYSEKNNKYYDTTTTRDSKPRMEANIVGTLIWSKTLPY